MPRRAAFVAIFALLTVSALTSSAQQKAAREGVAPFRTVRGSVVAGNPNADPLRRVRIVLAGGNTVASPAYTDDQGRFEVLVPASAPYELRFTKPGFAPQDLSRVASAPTDDLRVTLALGAAVTGRVTDQFGDPLLVRVRVRRVADESGRRLPVGEWIADADDLGEFRAGSLPAGRFEVRIDPLSPPGTGTATSSPSSRTAAVVDVDAGDEATLNLVEETQPMDPRGRVIGSTRTPVVQNGGTIRGRVVGPDARSVGGAFVILTAGIEGARETATDAEGRYEFAGLPAGSYRITAAKLGTAFTMRDRNIEVTVGERQVNAGVNVVMQKRSAVSGTVVDHYGDPLEGLGVELWRVTHRDGRDALQRPEGASPRRTDDRGRYRLFRVVPGEYYVAAGGEPRVRRGAAEGADSSLRVYYPGTPVVADAVRVRVAVGEDTAGIDITHAPPTGARVYGSAFDSTGRPLKFPVTLVESSRSGPMQAERTARVREDGAFEFLNVPTGEYVVQGILRPAPGRSSELGFAFVSVAATDAPPVTLRTSRGTTVRGRAVFEGDATAVQPDSFGVGAYPSDATMQRLAWIRPAQASRQGPPSSCVCRARCASLPLPLHRGGG
jgi:protocatechuate 3,4-dioxygenase beta subunit